MGAGEGGTPRAGALPRSTLRGEALRVLRARITAGDFAAGAHLSEVELAEDFAVSRGTVRESLRHLEQEGLVVADHRGRLLVRTVQALEVVEVFEVRAALEALAARGVIALPDEDRRAALDQLRDAVEVIRAAPDLVTQVEADLAFHEALCQVSGNGVLLRTWRSLESLVRLSIMRAGPAKALENMDAGRHHGIFEAVEAGDADRAAAVVVEHMRVASANITGTHGA